MHFPWWNTFVQVIVLSFSTVALKKIFFLHIFFPPLLLQLLSSPCPSPFCFVIPTYITHLASKLCYLYISSWSSSFSSFFSHALLWDFFLTCSHLYLVLPYLLYNFSFFIFSSPSFPLTLHKNLISAAVSLLISGPCAWHVLLVVTYSLVKDWCR